MTEAELLAIFAPSATPEGPVPTASLAETNIEARIAAYVARLNVIAPTTGGGYRYELIPNPRGIYRRIVMFHGPNDRYPSVHAFVDAAGNVYKAAGWKAPVKDGGRFHLANDDDYARLTALHESAWSGGYLYVR